MRARLVVLLGMALVGGCKCGQEKLSYAGAHIQMSNTLEFGQVRVNSRITKAIEILNDGKQDLMLVPTVGAGTSLAYRGVFTQGSTLEVPAGSVLKLFVDMLPDKVSFNQRPCAFIGIAAGQFQALRAVEHFQGVAGYRNAIMYPNRVFIGSIHKLLGPDGKLTDAALVERLKVQAAGFVKFTAALKA